MKVHHLHGWQASVSQAFDIQKELAARVSRVSEVNEPRLIAGVDISVSRARSIATGAVVVINYPSLELVEMKTVTGSSRKRVPPRSTQALALTPMAR